MWKIFVSDLFCVCAQCVVFLAAEALYVYIQIYIYTYYIYIYIVPYIQVVLIKPFFKGDITSPATKTIGTLL